MGFCASGAEGRTMNNFAKPIIGLGWTSNIQLCIITSSKYFQSAAVTGRRNTIFPPDTKP